MSTDDTRFSGAIERFDAANGEDPSRTTVDGREQPAALVYARRMSGWLDRLEPGASEALRLAAHSQHIRRWMMPRASYPMTRVGYLQWRTMLGRFHAEQAGQILADVGYDAATIERVRSLLRKERLKADPETQTLEDVICLVFLENEFADFAARHEDAKVIDILQKTWRKMSPRGHAAALALAPQLPATALRLVQQALAAKSE